jgi:glucokinase
MFGFPVLLGDIGGTNARFGILPGPGESVTLLPRALTAVEPSPLHAIATALQTWTGPAPRSAMLAVANRVDSLRVQLTNADWVIDAAAIGTGFGLERVRLVNDYPPVAASMMALDLARGDLAPLGAELPTSVGTRVVLGPGTGLGAAALVPVEEQFLILATEAGHMELGPADDSEAEFWPHVERVEGRVTSETLLSGPGLTRIAAALSRACGQASPFTGPADVVLAGLDGTAPIAAEALRIFSRLLGRFAGDLVLAYNAAGGVFIAGGIAPRLQSILQEGGFRQAFERKQPQEAWVRRVPTYLILNPEPAFEGLATMVTMPGRFIFPFRDWIAR